jgi:choline dehydrogenase-like flavoprotein
MSDVLILLDCPYAETITTSFGNGVTELIAANAYSAENDGVRKHSFADEFEAELRTLSKLPSFSIGNFYQNLLCRNQSENAEQGKSDPAPIYVPLTQPDSQAPRSIRIGVHEDDISELHSPRLPTTPGSMYSNGDSIPSFQMSSAIGHGKIPRIAFALRLKDQFRVPDLSSDLFMNWLENIPAAIEGVKIEAAFHSSSSLLIVSIPICMSIYMPPNDATINLGPITSFNQVLSRFQLPHDLPTPNPESGFWDHVPNSSSAVNGMRNNGHVSGLNGVNGGSNGQKTTRFREQAQYIPESKLDSKLRPRYERAYSSGRSGASSFTEEPSPATSFDGNYEPEEPELGSCQVPTDGGAARGSSGSQSKSNARIRNYTDDPHEKQFPRLSKPVELLRNTYDCIVIGSGYGGGVAASRMSRAGQKVCVLERGQEKWPGEYPSGFIDAMKQFHVSGEFAPDFVKGNMVEGGDPTGLYHLIVGKGQNAFVGNGLGGTSLLNANVFLEADKGTMGLEDWPKELRREGELDKYYQRARDVLQPATYPHDWPTLPKLSMLEKQAELLEQLGIKNKFYRVPQTTRFVGGPNSTGVEMYPSALTGMDSTGVNDGSKSSTLVNYLSDAWNWGAEMFCECEVRYIKKNPSGGYLVFFAWHGSNRGAFRERLYEDLMWVHARNCVFLGAGSIGTTEILLRSKKLGLSMSDKVGTGMSGNGDMLSFGYNTHDEVNAIGRQHPSPYNPIGPTISGVIDCRDGHDNPLDGFVIQEGAIPKALAPWFQMMLELMPGNQMPKGEGLLDKMKHVAAQFGSRFLGPYFKKGSIEKTQVYLVMSHDSNQAILTLKNDKPVLEFQGVANSSGVDKIHDLLKEATLAVGGTYVRNPFESYFSQEITVHPVGGACMSKDGTADHGVTNHFGEVLTGHGTETHQGLVVTDGAVIPTALGVNPFATITALAERSVEHAARDIRKHIDFETRNEILDLFGSPGQYKKASGSPQRKDTMQIATAKKLVEETMARKANGFGFSEVMSGYVHIGDGVEGDKPEDFETAAKTARGLCEESRFFLSVQTFDTATSKF